MTSAKVNPYFHFWLAINVTQTLGESTIHTLANKYSKVCHFLIICDICVKWQWSSGDLQSEPSPHGIIQTRTLEWVAISSSRESSWSRDRPLISRQTPCSCQENPMDRGGWRATVHRATKSWTWLSMCARTHTHTHTHTISECWEYYIIVGFCALPNCVQWSLIGNLKSSVVGVFTSWK